MHQKQCVAAETLTYSTIPLATPNLSVAQRPPTKGEATVNYLRLFGLVALSFILKPRLKPSSGS